MKRPWICAFLLTACALLVAGPVLADEPWLAGMPSVDKVVAATQGSDAFDTAARQFVAFDHLASMQFPLEGNQVTLTPAALALFRAYHDKEFQVLADLKASLPADQRDYYVGTQFTQWSALRDRYFADQQFSDQLVGSLFSASFRTTYGSALTQSWRALSGGIGVPPAQRPPLVPTNVSLAVLALIGFLIPILLKRGRMELDGNNAFKLHLGGADYALNHVGGVVEHPSKMATTQVSGGGGGGSFNEYGGYVAPVVIKSTTTVHDQFFLRSGDGRVEPIQLSGWNFPVAEGHLVSAVWAIRRGANSGPYVLLRNHTTRDASLNNSYLNDHLMRWGGFGLLLLQLALAIGAGFVAAPIVGLPQGVAAALVGEFLGSVIWHFAVRPRFLARFRRVAVPRLAMELDRLVSATPATA